MTNKELEQKAEKFCENLIRSGLICSGGEFPAFIAGAESQAVITEREVRQKIYNALTNKDMKAALTEEGFKKIILGTSEVGKL